MTCIIKKKNKKKLLFRKFLLYICIKRIYRTNIKKIFSCVNINMINLSLDELKLVAKNRNIRDYESKSEKDLIKVLSEPKPKIRINKKNLEEIRKYFNELRHKFSKKEIDKYRKSFYDIKNYRYLSGSEIEVARKNLNELKKCLRFKKFHSNVDNVHYDDLDYYDYNYDAADTADDDDKYRKIGSIRRLFKGFDIEIISNQ